jgi:hypothetical protein
LAMAAARVPARGRAAARRASGPAVVVVEGAGGGGDEEELEEGEEWVYICSQRISWAFRGGFGPGLFDPCVGGCSAQSQSRCRRPRRAVSIYGQ